MARKEPLFTSEAALVAVFGAEIERRNAAKHLNQKWCLYHETAGWDVLAVDQRGVQVGIEAKLGLNAKVLEQALPGHWSAPNGPDYRAVLVPSDGLQHHLERIAAHLGVTVITVRSYRGGPPNINPTLPDEDGGSYNVGNWHPWHPAERCQLPDYIPDVIGGHASPLTLSLWKIAAIKLVILLDRQGLVTRADMKALKLSPSRWTDRYNGLLSPGPEGGYVRCARTPDFKAQHPTNWAQIEADFSVWSKHLPARLPLEAA